MNLRRAAKRAYHTTEAYKLSWLLAEQTRWQRKQTIATNKLEKVRKQIDEMASTLAKEKAGVPEDRGQYEAK